ncbi:endogenous retrovirus group S71 member 1 Env polyprotein-like [Varanus komodoensis]|uniref:endogenous retrovirus group S71 member 1 Env polyprotein-like n=1 Tax=Varanus komodoensis TaxID=61221 RepID=UPI001CF7C157|nr:endogenous retrovirus group S71 member 1 Env polyprotein-like [Varanus komodoensis]
MQVKWTLRTDLASYGIQQNPPPLVTILTHTHDTSPVFRIDLCQLLPPRWRNLIPPSAREGPSMTRGYIGQGRYGCGDESLERNLQTEAYYGCPADGSPDCGDASYFYCAQWGCETFATWMEGEGRGKDHWIVVERVKSSQRGVGKQNPLSLTIQRGQEDSWAEGKTWGLRLYVTGKDPGVRFTIQKQIIPQPWGPVGPNRVLKYPEVADLNPAPRPPTEPFRSFNAARPQPKGPPPPQSPADSSRLYKLVTAVFQVLNETNPNITGDCWLCLSPQPPFYTGVGVNASLSDFRNLSYSENYQARCQWGLYPTITLEGFSGVGTCVTGPQGPLNDPRCASTITLAPGTSPYLLAAPNGTLFACRAGLTPCISSTLLMALPSPSATQAPQPDLCILTLVLPKIYLADGEVTPIGDWPVGARVKRAVPLLAPLLLDLGVARSAAVGAGALIKGNKDIFYLSKQVDTDLQELHGSIRFLEQSLDSLAEVALQNRRELDLLLLKQGGLCAALDEKCCFYANHSGVIRNSLDLVRARIEDREKRRMENSNWYQRLFSWSPWLTSLLSSLAGPLLGLLFLLISGPLLIQWLSRFVQKHINTIKVLTFYTRPHPGLNGYSPLPMTESRNRFPLRSVGNVMPDSPGS